MSPSSPRRPERAPATREPVASVLVDVSLAHLDRPFDYLVPADLDEAVVPGCRVKVRFAGRRVDGFVLARGDATDHTGRLAFLEGVVSSEPVLTPEVAALCRSIADRYVGSLSDVVRLAIPPRHARAEAGVIQDAARSSLVAPSPVVRTDPQAWPTIDGGSQFLADLASGGHPRGVLTVPPGIDARDLVVEAVTAARASERSVIVVVPDHRDAEQLRSAIEHVVGADSVVHSSADVGPAERYRRFLMLLRGSAQIVVGTRSTVLAPVRHVGLVVVWDDGDDLLVEPRAPYPHAREAAVLRAAQSSAGFLIVGHARSTEGERLVRSGWARPLTAPRTYVRAHAPVVHVAGSDHDLARDSAARTARIPEVVLRTVRQALTHGPVLVQVPRAGYVPALACQQCRAMARCTACQGPLDLADAGAVPTCRWCGAHDAWACPACSSTRLRAVRVGSGRTAEELGRAFPGTPVLTSGREGVVDVVADRPCLVVATPGAEPRAEGGYAAAVLLDGDVLLARPDLRAVEEAARRWFNAAALVRAGSASRGEVVIVADAASDAVQALVRWDPEGLAGREFEDRASARMPPAARVASITATPAALARVRELLTLPPGAEVLGPTDVTDSAAMSKSPPDEAPFKEPHQRLVVRVPLAGGAALSAALREVQAVRSSHKEQDFATIMIDPLVL